MVRDKIVSFFLIFCFSIISIHDIVPHSHLHDNDLINKDLSFIDGDKKGSNDNHPINIFSHMPHAGAQSTAYLDAPESYLPIVKIILFLPGEFKIAHPLEIENYFKIPSIALEIIASYVSSSSPLRGPPAL